jgi:enterochelin esterase-like enzyme
MTPEEHVIPSSSGEYARKGWLVPGPQGMPQKLCIFLDAEFYLDRMDTLLLLADLEAAHASPPATYLFISHVNGAARHADYPCNPRYARFLANDVVRWIKARNEMIQENGHLICGRA